MFRPRPLPTVLLNVPPSFDALVPPAPPPPPPSLPSFSLHTLNVIYWHCFNCKDYIFFLVVVLKGRVDIYFLDFISHVRAHIKRRHHNPDTRLWGALTVCVCVGGGVGEECFEQQGSGEGFQKRKKN